MTIEAKMDKTNEHHEKEQHQFQDIIDQLIALNEKEGRIVANIEDVQAAVANITGDVSNVQRVLGELNASITALQAQVADLQAQLAAGTGVTAEQLQAVLDEVNSADASLDSLTGDTPATP